MSYPVAQKRYDSWRNEWDCCEAFQPQARIDEDMEDVILYTRDGASEINPYDNDLLPPTVSFPFGSEDAPTPNPCTNAASSAADIEGNLDGDNFNLFLLQSAYETVEVLSRHHDFVTPPSFPSCSSLTEVEATQDQTKFLRLLGITPINQKISSTSIGTIAMSFLNNIVKGSCPDKGSWDLEKYNANSLVNARCLKYLHYI